MNVDTYIHTNMRCYLQSNIHTYIVHACKKHARTNNLSTKHKTYSHTQTITHEIK